MSEPMYAPEQIVIPPGLPEILKQFTKAAIRTQPGDIYAWAQDYFTALSQGDRPPAANRVTIQRTANFSTEEPSSSSTQESDEATATEDSSTESSSPNLNAVYNKLKDGPNEVEVDAVKSACAENGVENIIVADTLGLLGATSTVVWLQFFTLLCGSNCEDLQGTLVALFDIIADNGVADAFAIKQAVSFLSDIDHDVSEEDKNKKLAQLDGVTTDGKVPADWAIAQPTQSTEEPAAEEPKTEEPVVEEPVVEESTAVEEENTIEDPVVEEPKTEEPVVEEEAKTEEPVVEEEAKTEEPVVEEEAKTEEPVAEETKTEEPVAEEPKTEDPAVEEETKTEEAVAEEQKAE